MPALFRCENSIHQQTRVQRNGHGPSIEEDVFQALAATITDGTGLESTSSLIHTAKLRKIK